MIILHAGLDAGQLLLWGEVPGAVPAPRSGRKPKTEAAEAPDPYPFDAGGMPLAVSLISALPGGSIPGGSGTPPVAWMPTVRGRPVPSSGLIADVPVIGEVALEPWTVTALPLPVHTTIDLLCACVGKDSLAPGVLIGKTLAFWTQTLRFAGSLVARERFMPGVRQTGNAWQAVWQPVISGIDGQRLARLSQAMPAACRALTRQAESPPDRPAIELVTEFLHRITDALVRLALHGPANATGRGGRVQVQRLDSAHDQWLFALNNSADGALNLENGELSTLVEQVRSWQRPVTVSTQTAFGLCFRLEEPGPDDPPATPWKVRYLLQASDDPSLIFPLSDAWKRRGRAAEILDARKFDPREFLLTSLGLAASLSPGIEISLSSQTPIGFQTDEIGAYRFLSESAYLLEQAGFTVLLPAWWSRGASKAKLSVQAEVEVPPAMKVGGGLSMNQIVQFKWQVALGDEKLTLAELRGLAKLKTPLVKVRGQWVRVKQEEIEAAIALLEQRIGGEASVRDVVQMALGGGVAPGGLPFGGVISSGWIADFLNQLEGKSSFEEMAPPSGFQGTLRPYQVRGYSWLTFLQKWGLGACLADDMGLGKTIQTLAMIQEQYKADPRPTLLICPTSVVANWMKEAERFTPDLRVLIHHGGRRTRSDVFVKQVAKYAIVVSSYTLLHRDRDLFAKVAWAGLVLDEAQNIKNAQTKQSQAARSLQAGFRVALTGTPVENHVGDLWAIMEFLNPGWLGTHGEFRRRFFVPIQAQQDAEAATKLRRLTTPFVLRRVKTDKSVIADLPDKLEMKVFCNLTREQATLYQSVVDVLNESLESAGGMQRKGIILATLTKLKQVCNHPAHFLDDDSAIPDRSGKLARLTEMLEEIMEAGEKVLIFSQYVEMGEILKKHLQEAFGREVLFLHGGVPREQRTRMVERFQTEADGPRIFILSLKAGGTGLNLTAATHVFHFDRWWNPAVENQATDRAYRIGQTETVQVHKFICVGTVEEKIDEMIEKKQRVAEVVVAAKEDWLTELSNEQLKDLFTLRQEAIGE
jgi:hypothetical protein